MTAEGLIAALVAQADRLRSLSDAESEAAGLPALVDRINALRADPAAETAPLPEPVEEGADAAIEIDSDAPAAKKRGRPRKVDSQ